MILLLIIDTLIITHMATPVAQRAGKINQILHYDWLPGHVSLCSVAHLGLPAVSSKNFPESHYIINPLLTKLVQSRWLDIDLHLSS